MRNKFILPLITATNVLSYSNAKAIGDRDLPRTITQDEYNQLIDGLIGAIGSGSIGVGGGGSGSGGQAPADSGSNQDGDTSNDDSGDGIGEGW